MAKKKISGKDQAPDLLTGRSAQAVLLYNYFLDQYKKIGDISVHPAKTMIGIGNAKKRIAWVTQFGKTFIHIVFPFKKAYPDNMCFTKIAQVPGDLQFNHHFRMLLPEDLNAEVISFMKLAFEGE